MSARRLTKLSKRYPQGTNRKPANNLGCSATHLIEVKVKINQVTSDQLKLRTLQNWCIKAEEKDLRKLWKGDCPIKNAGFICSKQFRFRVFLLLPQFHSTCIPKCSLETRTVVINKGVLSIFRLIEFSALNLFQASIFEPHPHSFIARKKMRHSPPQVIDASDPQSQNCKLHYLPL